MTNPQNKQCSPTPKIKRKLIDIFMHLGKKKHKATSIEENNTKEKIKINKNKNHKTKANPIQFIFINMLKFLSINP